MRHQIESKARTSIPSIPKPIQPLLRAEDVSRLLSVSVSTVYDWVRWGYIPHVRLGTGKKKPCVRFDLDEIMKWLDARKRQGRTTRVPTLLD